MKKLVYTLTAITAIAALLSSCVKSADEQLVVEKSTTVAVEVAPAESRTFIEGTEIRWAESGEQLNIIYFADDSTTRRQSATHEDYTLTNNCAEFSADITATDGATQYTFGAFYPYAYKSTTSSISLTVPQEQTPTESSYDPLTDILVSENPVVTESVPSKISFKFARMVAFAKMTLVGIPAGEKIEKVVFSSAAKPAGAVEFKVHEQGTLETAKWYNNYEDITLYLGGRTATGEDTVWFTTVPTDLSGSSFTVTVVTDRVNYTKTVDLTDKKLTFERADVAQFRVTDLVEQQKPLAYKLLTDASELTAGDQFIIATKSYATSSARAISTIANGTKLVHTDSFAIEDGPQIITLPENVALFTVEKGATEGSLAFKTSEGYLYGNYDSDAWANTLSFKATVDDEASWVVTVDSSNKASIFNEKYSRYVNYYSSASFNFANSASSTYIYYIDGTATEEPETPVVPEQPVVTPLEAPVVTATATANTVTVEWTAVEGAKDYTVVCGEQSVTVTATTATFENVAAGSYKVTVTANPADEALHTASKSEAVEVVVEDAPAEGGDAQAQSVTLTFPTDFPEGATSGNSVGTIYSGDVIISSTGSWRTNNADGRDCIYIGRTTSGELRIEAQNGKVITKVTLTAPVGYLVDLKWKEYDGFTSGTYSDSWSGECKSRIVFTAAGSSHSNIESITVEYK
ncbi:MAG: hypothetical protein J6K57_05280 [Alistipes sp.]|nr:hypothetical protein [Alistipes sp.]